MPEVMDLAETRMTWNEMVDKYPDMWVAVKDAQMDGPDIVSGIVVAVLSDIDVGQFRIKNKRKGLVFSRTTEGFFNGVTGSSIIISVD